MLVILASTSPRRKELLRSIGVDFIVLSPQFDESSVTENNPINRCVLTAQGKAENAYTMIKDDSSILDKLVFKSSINSTDTYSDCINDLYLTNKNLNKNFLIIAADTLIYNEENTIPTGNFYNIFGKPKNENETRKMLASYSGKTHNVITAICGIDKNGILYEKHSISTITFKKLSKQEIDFYIKTDEWKDAAGGYKIQDRAGLFIEKIEGSYTGIVGLPLFELNEIFAEVCENNDKF